MKEKDNRAQEAASLQETELQQANGGYLLDPDEYNGVCKRCGEVFETRAELEKHINAKHRKPWPGERITGKER